METQDWPETMQAAGWSLGRRGRLSDNPSPGWNSPPQAWSCSSLSLQALVQRLSYQPGAKSSIWNMAIWAFKKAHGVTECRKKRQREECGDGEWFPVSAQLSLQAPPFCVSWRAAACLWLAKALSQLLRAGPEGRGGWGAEPALRSSWLERHV